MMGFLEMDHTSSPEASHQSIHTETSDEENSCSTSHTEVPSHQLHCCALPNFNLSPEDQLRIKITTTSATTDFSSFLPHTSLILPDKKLDKTALARRSSGGERLHTQKFSDWVGIIVNLV
jgi:hypothetical protein